MQSNHQSKETHKAAGATKQEIEQGKGMAIVAYIIALIPYFAGDKKNKFVHFHAVQGMNILIYCVIWSVIASILSSIFASIFLGGCWSSLAYWATGAHGGGMCSLGLYGFLNFIVWIPSMILGVIDLFGLVYAIQGKMKKVPLLGKLPAIIKK